MRESWFPGMTTSDSHSILSRYSRACWYSGRKPNVVRSPEQTTTSGLEVVDLVDRALEQARDEVRPPAVEVGDVRDPEAAVLHRGLRSVGVDRCRFSQSPFVVESKSDRREDPVQYMLLIYSNENGDADGDERRHQALRRVHAGGPRQRQARHRRPAPARRRRRRPSGSATARRSSPTGRSRRRRSSSAATTSSTARTSTRRSRTRRRSRQPSTARSRCVRSGRCSAGRGGLPRRVRRASSRR